MGKRGSLGIGVEYKIGIISSLSATVIWAILLSFWSLIAANIYSLFHSNVMLWQYFIAGISVGVALMASVLFYKDKSNKYKPHFPALSMDYMYKKVETEMHFINRIEITHTSNFDILALNKVEGMKRTNRWSGSSISELPILESTYNHTVELLKNEPGKTVYVKFEVPLQKNQQTDCKLVYKLGDSTKQMQPFLGHLVKNPTEQIILRICVPKDENMLKSVQKCIYADSSAHIPLSQPQIIKPHTIGYNKVYEWKIDNPSLLYFYRINWEFVLLDTS